MPSLLKTAFLQLNKWAGNEYPKREDFVSDNEKIDAFADDISSQMAQTADYLLTKVDKTGDTITGDLSIQKNAPSIKLKHFATGSSINTPIIASNNDGDIWRIGGASGSGHLSVVTYVANSHVSFSSPAGIQINGVQILTGNGSPEGFATALLGSLYLRKDGGASTTLYVKQSGTGNTGWVAK